MPELLIKERKRRRELNRNEKNVDPDEFNKMRRREIVHIRRIESVQVGQSATLTE